jgi:hypothetical protein
MANLQLLKNINRDISELQKKIFFKILTFTHSKKGGKYTRNIEQRTARGEHPPS